MRYDIPDPAARISGTLPGSTEHAKALEDRYETGPIAMAVPHFAERYGNVCDLIVQLLWPEIYGATPDDPYQHTSQPARDIARLIFHAAGIEPDGNEGTAIAGND